MRNIRAAAHGCLLLVVLAAMALSINTSASADPPGPSGPPESTSTMYPSGGGGATPATDYECTVDHGISTSYEIAVSWTQILNCYVDGVPTEWEGIQAKTVLQTYIPGAGEWVTVTTGTGADYAQADWDCQPSTAWRNVATAAAYVDGVYVSGGPWYNNATCRAGA